MDTVKTSIIIYCMEFGGQKTNYGTQINEVQELSKELNG